MALHSDEIWLGANPQKTYKGGYSVFVPYSSAMMVWDTKTQSFTHWGILQLKAENNAQRNMVIKFDGALNIVEMKVFTTLAFTAKAVDVSTLPAYTVKVAEEGTTDIFLKRWQEFRQVFGIEFAEEIDHFWD